MKLPPRDINNFFKSPPASMAGVLIYGSDAMRVALKRQELLKSLLGPNADSEMRLTQLAGAEIKKDPAQVSDAQKAQGFFPGARAVFIDNLPDTAAKPILNALDDWNIDDATLLITAGQLKPSSALRKGFENHKNSYAIAIYDNPLTRQEIEHELQNAKISKVNPDAMEQLQALGRELEPGDFRQTIEKLALYKFNDDTPVSLTDIDACAPTSTEADIDDMLNVVASGDASAVSPILRKLKSQGTQPVTICIGMQRHFKALLTIASDAGGPDQGVSRLRPPVFGPRRDQILRQAKAWGKIRLGDAITILTDLDLQLRSANQHAPAMELVERNLIRLAMLSRR